MSGDYTTSAGLLGPQPSSPDLVIDQISPHANCGRRFFDGVGKSLELYGVVCSYGSALIRAMKLASRMDAGHFS